MRIFAILLLLLSAAVGITVSHAGEAEDRKEIGVAAADAFKAGRFADLDATADRFRMSRERTGSGAWKLDEFYNGLRLVNLDKNFNEASVDRFEAQALLWAKERPQSIAAKIVYATLLANHKWLRRGHSYWQELTEAQRAGFQQYHLRQRDYLVAIRSEASIDPEWYSLMMEIAMEEGWPDSAFDRLVAEAAEREPYYYSTWFGAIDRNLPQWGGNYSKMAELIRRITKASHESEGETLIARGYWSVYDGDGRGAAGQLGLSWPEIDKGFDDLVRIYPVRRQHQ